jgi:hypothetical protein
MDTEAEKVLEKKFACECGVAFLSADTLTSHRKYYCRNRVIDETEEQELTRKVGIYFLNSISGKSKEPPII